MPRTDEQTEAECGANSLVPAVSNDSAQGIAFLAGYSAVADAAHHDSTHGPSPLRRLIAMLAPEAGEVRMIVLFSATVGLLSIGSPVAVEALVNSVAFGGLIQPVIVLSLMLLACLVFAACITALEYYVVELIQRRLFVRSAARATLALSRAARTPAGEIGPAVLVNRFLEVAQIQKITAALLLDGIAILLTTVIGLTILAFYHPVLLAFDLVLIGAMLVLLFGLSRRGVATGIEESLAKHGLVRWLEQMAVADAVFRSRDGEQLGADVGAALTTRYLEARREHFRIVFRQLFFGLFVQVSASVALMGIGGWLVINGQMTLGQLVAAELIIALVTGHLAKVGKYIESFYDLMASVDKLESLLDHSREKSGEESPEGDPRGASLRILNAAYRHDAERLLFADLSLEVASGDSLAVIGGEGAGKSILAELIVGRRELSAGAIEMEGVDLRRWNLPALRGRAALVGSPSVVEATILENIRLARSAVSLEDARQALLGVELLDEVLALPDGINSRLGLDGSPLSAGQITRLMLARAMAGRAKLLLIDAALDGIEEPRRTRIWKRIRGEYPTTVVVLTRDANVAALCSRSIKLNPSHHSPT